MKITKSKSYEEEDFSIKYIFALGPPTQHGRKRRNGVKITLVQNRINLCCKVMYDILKCSFFKLDKII